MQWCVAINYKPLHRLLVRAHAFINAHIVEYPVQKQVKLLYSRTQAHVLKTLEIGWFWSANAATASSEVENLRIQIGPNGRMLSRTIEMAAVRIATIPIFLSVPRRTCSEIGHLLIW